MSHSPYRIKPGQNVKLQRISTDDTGDFREKQDAKASMEKNLQRLDELQNVLYADAQHAVLIVLQAMDAGGKDGTIDHIFSGVDPQGCAVTSFKAPSHAELAHDYLWRIHQAVPARGMIGIFNRSHYESVAVERINKIAPKSVWSKRYDHINAFEKMLADEGTTIIKIFLHISKKEQAQRLRDRLADKEKHWKFDPIDLKARAQWNDYMNAYGDAIEKCSTDYAPWYVIPADHKWFRNWAVSEVLVRTMEKLKLKFPPAAPGLDKIVIT